MSNERKINQNEVAKPSKESLWNRIKAVVRNVWERLDFLYWLELGLERLGRFIQSYEGLALIFFGVGISISAYSIYAGKARLASGMGLLWLFLFIGLFFLFSFTKEGVIAVKAFLNSSKDGSDGEVAIVLQSVLQFFAKAAEKVINTLASLTISLAYLIGQLHLKSAAGDLDHLFVATQWSWMDWCVLVLLPLIGLVSDAIYHLKKIVKKNSIVTVAGIAQFYFLGAMLVTGLIGGAPPLEAAGWIFEHPFEWVFSEVPNVAYEESRAFAIIKGVGVLTFVYLYFLMPVYIYSHAKDELRKEEENEATLYSPTAARGLIGFSLIFMMIFLYVAWQQGWIVMAFEMLVIAIVWIIQQIGNVLHWLVDLFS